MIASRLRQLAVAGLLLTWGLAASLGQETTVPETTAPKTTVPKTDETKTCDAKTSDVATPNTPTVVAGVRRALIVCGLPGDADHRKLFGESIELLQKGLIAYHGFAAENIRILSGEKPTDKDPGAIRTSQDVTTRESLTAAATAIRAESGADDALWVIVIGHAHYDGRNCWLNLSGNDMNQTEFGALFAGLQCREQVFFITTACSGYYLKPLAQAGRVVISATEPDLEVNETLFPHKLARAIGSPPAITDFDVDGDGEFTVCDLYLLAARETSLDYATGELLATEHALLDDSGDGRGTEVQADYLTEAQGGRKRAGSGRPALSKGDGQRSRQIPLMLPASLTRPESPPEPPMPIDA